MTSLIDSLFRDVFDLAASSIDLEEFQEGLEALMEEYGLEDQDDRYTTTDYVAAGLTGGALGGALGELGEHAYKTKFKGYKGHLSAKKMALNIGAGAAGGALGGYIGRKWRQRRKEREKNKR